MTRTRLALAIAAFLAAPAFAQSTTEQPPLDKAAAKQSAAAPGKQTAADSTTKSTTSSQTDLSPSTKTTDGAYVAPLEKNASKQSASASGKQAKADSTTKSTTSTAADVNSRSVDGANVAPLEKNSAKQQAMADCADHPNAGKLADKSTGMAKEHSASPVHSDCVTDAKPKVAKKKSTKTAASETK
jgi:hypothetical protein